MTALEVIFELLRRTVLNKYFLLIVIAAVTCAVTINVITEIEFLKNSKFLNGIMGFFTNFVQMTTGLHFHLIDATYIYCLIAICTVLMGVHAIYLYLSVCAALRIWVLITKGDTNQNDTQ